MNKITIYQENQPPTILFDDDEYDETVLRDKLSFLFTASKIVKLTTKTKEYESMVILRPSKINSITVTNVEKEETVNLSDVENTEIKNSVEEIKIEPSIETDTKKQAIDIITD